jgi:DivIVA domain-containing protein
MAMSFARPDPSSPASIAEAGFSTGRRGFDQNEVRDFLRMVAAELGRLQERERFLERELRTAQASPDLSSAQLDDETVTRLLGEETARVLTAARESAGEIRAKAEQAAARLLGEASEDAARLRQEAELEASRRRADAAADAEAETEMAKQQGREMVNEARAYRERVLSELARRRELARQQIEQLIQGRDRLMQSFERARLVAVDVVAELQPLGEPDEYVDLTPTTGPVPVMVPNVAGPATADAAPAAEPGEGRAPDAADDAPTGPEPETIEVDGAAPATAPFDRELDDAADTAITDDHDAADDADAATTDDDAAADAATTDDDTAITEDGDAVAAETDDDHVAIPGEAADDDAVRRSDEEASGEDEGPGTDVHVGSGEDRASADGASGDAGDPGDAADAGDVVVDLFARIRAGVADGPAAAEDGDDGDDTGTPPADASGDEHATGPADAEPLIVLGDAPVDVAGRSPDLGAGDVVGDVDHRSADDGEVDTVSTSPFERRDEDLTPLIVAAARKLKRVLADEQNEVLDALRRGEPVENLDILLPWASEHVARYTGAIADDLAAAARAGAASVAAGTASGLRRKDSKDAVARAGTRLEEYVVAPLRDRLERAVAEGAGDNGAITKTVRAVYREWKTRRIDEHLDDVVRVAHGRGVLGGVEPGMPVEWVTDPSVRACADCDDNVLGGAVEAGAEFPTGHTFAPAHPGCRCLLQPAGR